MTTGERLLEIMKERGITKAELAEMAFMSWPTIDRMCSGDRVGQLNSWMRVSEALGMPLDEIVGKVTTWRD